ncbi:MAG: tetratricopeptide repeat protein [Alphaproteobacteria bacterium]|nr:tetratricopeptide repeat protein [Alphaproteobacteria bacterium]MDP6588345.1 tetratricopeptide repeat protein [Alphaproteobacteria bacterium]MDP6816846.1 tetratricopeptide repeat protein [Alphaproteobacteria bacterium]
MNPLEEAARHLKAGRPEDAARLCLGVVKEAPESSAAWSLLGNVRVAEKRYADAIRCYGRVLAEAPDAVEVHSNLGAVHQLLGESKRAAECFRRAIALKPDYAQAHCNLGVSLRKLGRLDEAIACQHRAIEIAPEYAKAHYNLGNALKQACEVDAAIAAYQRAKKFDPGHAETRNNLATVFESQGHTEKALGEFSRAMEMDQSYVEAHYNYALLHRFEAGDPLLEKLRRLDREQGQSAVNRNRLAFALAKVNADLGDYDDAFARYRQANAARRQNSNYDKSAAAREVDTIISRNAARRDGAPLAAVRSAPIPLFVLGLSRSGKTLVEALLAAQPGVFAAGESEHWQRLRRAMSAKGTNEAAPARLGEEYREEMRRLAGNAKFFISTLDSNILWLAEIAAALPEARFILCRREALDNALLIYFKRYEQGHAHAYDFDDIAHFMAQRARLQVHWRGLYGKRIMTLEYEALVRGSAAMAARIAEHSGLVYDDGAAAPRQFHEQEIGIWKCYEKHTQALRAALDRQRRNR